MSAENMFTSNKPENDAVYIRHSPGTSPTNNSALVVHQAGGAGTGSAIKVVSDNASGAAVDVKATGPLMNMKNAAGVSKLLVANDGAITAAGFSLPILAPVYRRPAWRPATTLFSLGAAGHGWVAGGSGTASSDVNSTDQFIKGTQSARLTTTGDTVQSQIRKTGVSAMNLTGKSFRILIQISDVTKLNIIQFTLGTSTFTNFFKWTLHTHSASNPNYVQSGEWVYLTVAWADVESAGGTFSIASDGQPSVKTGFTDMQVSIKDAGTGAISWYLQSVEIVADTTVTFSGGVCSITFDDSWKSVYDYARPKMDALGYRGTSYQIADLVGADSTHVSLADLRALQNLSGWEIGGHAYSSANHSLTNGFADMTAQNVNLEFQRMKAWLITNGFNGDGLAYPKGRFAATTDGIAIDQLAAQYWSTSRTIISETKEQFGLSAFHRLRAITGINDGSGLGGTTVAALTATGGPLDRCQLSGDWLILCFHKLLTTTPTSSDECSQTGFNTVMDAINSRSIPVMPVSDVMRYYA